MFPQCCWIALWLWWGCITWWNRKHNSIVPCSKYWSLQRVSYGCFSMESKEVLQLGNYSKSNVDIIINTIAYTLNLDLSIYQTGPDGSIQVKQQNVKVEAKFIWSLCTTHRILFTHHYDAIFTYPSLHIWHPCLI